MDIHAMLRAVRAGKSNRYIADNLGVDRRTVSKYRQLFERQNLLNGELPELEQLNRLVAEQLPNKEKGRPSSIEPWAQPIQQYVDKGLTPRLIYQRLSEDPRFSASESAIAMCASCDRRQSKPQIGSRRRLARKDRWTLAK